MIKKETLKERKKQADSFDKKGTVAYKKERDFAAAKDCYLKAFQIRFALRWETEDAEIKHDIALSFWNMSTLVNEEGDTDRAKKLKQHAWLLFCEAGKEKAMAQTGAVCVLLVKGIEANKLVKYIMQVADIAKKPAILVIDDPDKLDDNGWIHGIAIDRHNIGMKEILRETAHITKLDVSGGIYIFSLQKADAEKVQKEVLARASEI